MKTMIALALLAPLAVFALLSGCSKGSTTAVESPAPAKVAAAASGEQLCRRDLTVHVKFKDPDSVRINSIKASGHTVEHYDMSVSAKNSYGGYGDPMECSCIAEPDHDRLRYMFCGGAS